MTKWKVTFEGHEPKADLKALLLDKSPNKDLQFEEGDMPEVLQHLRLGGYRKAGVFFPETVGMEPCSIILPPPKPSPGKTCPLCKGTGRIG